MDVSPSHVSCHAKNYSCPRQITFKQMHESGAECKSGGVPEQKDQLESDIISTKSGDNNGSVSLCDATEPRCPTSAYLKKNFLNEGLDPSPVGACKAYLTDKSSSLNLGASDKKLDFVSEGLCSELGAACTHIIASEGKNPLEPGVVQAQNIMVNETLQPLAELTEKLGQLHEDASKTSQTDRDSSPQQIIPGQLLKFPSSSAGCKPSEKTQDPGSELVQNGSVEIGTTIYSSNTTEHLESPPELGAKTSSGKDLDPPLDNEINIPATEHLGQGNDEMNKDSMVQQLQTPSNNVFRKSSGMGHRVRSSAKSSKEKNMLRSLLGSDRVLRSRSQEKPKAPEPSNNPAADVDSNTEKKRKRMKRRKERKNVADEYTRIRAHLRYLLTRVNYEQSLITAYSGEGWKGLSLEKLKPEKELQRATSEIFRRKLKIRDLFQRIDLLCAEGRFPASLFDSDGQIDSEDIFCAKCGSKDLTIDNDIILCDGACDRGFHQFCLVPPLLKEDIPSDDEGWLCPGCDCKVDCIDLLNKYQGTKLSIIDSWEKVFPEAAAMAASGQNLDNNFGLPSDDSDDNDYDPDGPELDEKSQGDESSSDESDFASASDGSEAAQDEQQYLGLPSEDSEDNDYDPDAKGDLDEKAKHGSSSSDFSSDSEDLAAVINNNELSGEDGNSDSHKSSNGRKSVHKKSSLKSQLSSLLEPDGSTPVSAKRNVERLDDKKLYDETYGNASSDSSEDEDFTDDIGPQTKRKGRGDVDPTLANGNASEQTPDKRSRKRSKFEGTNSSPVIAHQGSSASSSSGKRNRSSTYKRLGEGVTQRLYKSFKENQYPDRGTKESLVKELGLTFQQVSKWFENARWSFNHPTPLGATVAKTNLEKASGVPKTNETIVDIQSQKPSAQGTAGGDVRGSKQKIKTPKPRRGKEKSGHQTLTQESRTQRREKIPPTKAPEKPAGSRKTTRRKSGT